jgi:hypothetical protein
MIPVRVQRDQAPVLASGGRVFPMKPGHPLHGTECPACGEALAGDVVLVYVGREPDGLRDGWTTGGSVAVHKPCAEVTP